MCLNFLERLCMSDQVRARPIMRACGRALNALDRWSRLLRERRKRERVSVCVWQRERERVREWERERTCGLVHFIQHPSSYLEHESERELTEDQNKTQYFWVARLSRFRIGSVAFSRNSRLQFCFFLWFPGNQGDCHRTKSRLASILLLREVRVATSQILIPGRLGLTCKYGFSSQRGKEI